MNRNSFLKSIAAACAVSMALWAAPARADDIPVQLTIDNLRVEGGPVRVALYDEAGWLSIEQALDTLVTDAGQPSISVRLAVPRAGRYGVAVYQDIDRDGELNRNIIGMPTEPWGVSNDAPASFGPPRFSDAAFTVGAQGAAARLRLR